MGHGPGAGMAGEKAKDLKGTMKKLIKYIRRYYVPIVFVILFAVASTIFNIVGPTILGDATTEIFNGLMRKVTGTGGIDFDKVMNDADGIVCCKCGIFLYTGIDHDACIQQYHISDEERYLRKNSPYADEIF